MARRSQTLRLFVQQTSAAGTNYVASLFIMEQYLDGPEVDVDIVLSKGEAVYGSITVSICRLLYRQNPIYSHRSRFIL
jgi:hypothetical protein